MAVVYKKGDLFSAIGQNTILVHACNCKGCWGSGIAVEFKNRFPEAYKDYQELCAKNGKNLLGMGIFFQQHYGKDKPPSQAVGYLFTSFGYGDQKDGQATILKNTRTAVQCLLGVTPKEIEIHSPKINSGLFAVPWEKTEKVINEVLKQFPNHKWIVWEK